MFVKNVAPFRETWRRSALTYDPPHDYSTEELVGIGAISKKVQFFKGNTWGKETTTVLEGEIVFLPRFCKPSYF